MHRHFADLSAATIGVLVLLPGNAQLMRAARKLLESWESKG